MKKYFASKRRNRSGFEKSKSFFNASDVIDTVAGALPTYEPSLRKGIFKIRVSQLATYKATHKDGEVVISEDEVYIPKYHFSKAEYKEAMKYAIHVTKNAYS